MSQANNHAGTELNRLNRIQVRRLEDFVNSKWDEIERHRPTVDQFAEEATRVLGFPISRSNVRGASRVFERHWPRPI